MKRRTRYHYWFSSNKMTIYVGTDRQHVITETAPIARKFIGQHSRNLANWMRKQGGFRTARLNTHGGAKMCSTAKVANMKKYKSLGEIQKAFGGNWIYIGRGDQRKTLDRSPLANPYSHHPKANATIVKDRQTAIAEYRKWLWHQIKIGNKNVIYELDKVGEDTVLMCYCAPMACHGEVVHRAAKWMRENGGVAGVMAEARKRRRQ